MKKSIIIITLLISSVVFSQQRLTPELMWKLGRVSDIQVSPDKKTLLFGITYYNLEKNSGNRGLYTIPVNGGEMKQVTDFKGTEYNGIWRPDGKKILFLSSEGGKTTQIWEMNPDGTNREQISKIPGGVTGFKYSPDMKNILFTKEVKMGKTATEVHPDLPEANAKIIDDLMYRHWNDWEDTYYSHLCVAPLVNGKPGRFKDLMRNQPYDTPLKPWGGMEQINWSPDGKKIAYTCKKLEGKEYAVSTNSDIYLYDLETGKTKNLSKGMEGYDKAPVFSPDSKKIAWQSMKTPGYESDKKRIMVYDLEKNKMENYSKNFEYSASNFVWDKDGSNLFFISGIHATYQVYSLEMKTGKIEKLTDGIHNYQNIILGDHELIATKMSMSMPTEIFKVSIKNGKEAQLSFVNKDILDKTEMGKVEKRWIETTDGKKMLTWVIYPPNFDKTKRYPALLYCQGGPQSAVSQFFSYRWNFQIMAAHDYIIVAPNRRGLPTFGREWNDQIAKDYGGQNMKDYLSAIDALSKETFVDESHLGAIGASYGGYSVFWLAGNHDNRFKAFISHCGMFHFESWYASTEEMFFPNHDFGGAYWEDPKPDSYKFSPHLHVNKWDTPIMIIHGGYDFRIPYTQGMQAFNVAQLQDVPSKFLFFPEESHFVLKPQNAVLWQREFFKWLDKWLKK